MKFSILFALLLIILSCTEKVERSEIVHSINSVRIGPLEIVNKTDPICDMDVKGHLSDTAWINGETWGFCSSVCKEKYVQLKKIE